MFRFLLQDVPFDRIRHNDLMCYVKEGYGGRPVANWPMYHFFAEYVHGERGHAQEQFEAWYKDQLNRYHDTPKGEGGMHKGSLYTLVENIAGVPFSEAGELHKNEAIRLRVAERFALLENIKNQGYRPDAERIDGIQKGDFVYLLGGHHRAAALYALERKSLPRVMVFPNQFMYNLWTILRNIKHGNLQK